MLMHTSAVNQGHCHPDIRKLRLDLTCPVDPSTSAHPHYPGLEAYPLVPGILLF